MEQGWDDDVKVFFVKILNSVAMTLLWVLAAVTAGLYFKLALVGFYWLLLFTGWFVICTEPGRNPENTLARGLSGLQISLF